MMKLQDAFGLDPDSTKTLVLTTADVFRLVHQLHRTHKGLEDSLLSRNNAQSRRNRYDRMKVCFTYFQWLTCRPT